MIFLSILWALVVLGTVYKLFFINRSETLSVALYLAMGWMVSFIAKPVWEQASAGLLSWITAGVFSTSKPTASFSTQSGTHSYLPAPFAMRYLCTCFNSRGH